MSGSVNSVFLIGNLTRDPEVRALSNGDPVVNMTVATSERWKSPSGERKERSEFHRVVIFNPHLCKIAGDYLHKGSKVCLHGGQLQTRSWSDNAGKDRYTTEIVLSKFRGELTMLDTKEGASSNGRTSDFDSGNAGSTPAAPATDEEIPWD